MKALLGVSLGIAIIVFFAETEWLGKSTLAPVIMALAIAIALQAVYSLFKKD